MGRELKRKCLAEKQGEGREHQVQALIGEQVGNRKMCCDLDKTQKGASHSIGVDSLHLTGKGSKRNARRWSREKGGGA